jgi:hypothetical protein
MEREYESFEEVFSDLLRLKDQFWCNHCEMGLSQSILWYSRKKKIVKIVKNGD